MITVPGFIPWLRYVVYSSSEGPECHLSHHHNYLQINGKKCIFLCYRDIPPTVYPRRPNAAMAPDPDGIESHTADLVADRGTRAGNINEQLITRRTPGWGLHQLVPHQGQHIGRSGWQRQPVEKERRIHGLLMTERRIDN